LVSLRAERRKETKYYCDFLLSLVLQTVDQKGSSRFEFVKERLLREAKLLKEN
jgi:hypothetical protein